MIQIVLLIFILWGAWLSFLVVKKVSEGASSFDAVDNSFSLTVLMLSPAFAHASARSARMRGKHLIAILHLVFAMGMWFLLLCALLAQDRRDYLLIGILYTTVWLANILVCRRRNKQAEHKSA